MRVEGDGSECARVVLERFIRRRREIQVVPNKPTVVRTDEEVVCSSQRLIISSSAKGKEAEEEEGRKGRTAERVNVETRDPLETGVERLDELLLHEVVDADVALGLFDEAKEKRREGRGGEKGEGQLSLSSRILPPPPTRRRSPPRERGEGEGESGTHSNEEMRPCRVELNLLNVALELGERRLGVVLRELVDEDGAGAGCGSRSRSRSRGGRKKEGRRRKVSIDEKKTEKERERTRSSNTRKIVTPLMPRHLLNLMTRHLNLQQPSLLPLRMVPRLTPVHARGLRRGLDLLAGVVGGG